MNGYDDHVLRKTADLTPVAYEPPPLDFAMGPRGKIAICKALGFDIKNVASLSIEMDHSGVYGTLKFFVTDDKAVALAEVLKQFQMVERA